MIKSKADYKLFLKEDRKALGITKPTKLLDKIFNFLSPNSLLKFQETLRKSEYYKNCSSNPFAKFYYYYIRFLLKKKSVKLGLTIPENTFGPGLAIVHYGTIVINVNSKIGANCRIHACTNIGASGGSKKAPIIGDNVYIGPGAKIYGDIKLANNIAISANAVVNKSFEEENILLAGNPAVKIKNIDITRIISHIKYK